MADDQLEAKQNGQCLYQFSDYYCDVYELVK